MLRIVRVKKSPDYPDETWFRLFKDGELINSVRIDDAIADDFARRLIPTPTTDELPPEREDILWWYPFGGGKGWRMGCYQLSETCLPGFLWSAGASWYLADGPT